jgi:hypothetical protein
MRKLFSILFFPINLTILIVLGLIFVVASIFIWIISFLDNLAEEIDFDALWFLVTINSRFLNSLLLAIFGVESDLGDSIVRQGKVLEKDIRKYSEHMRFRQIYKITKFSMELLEDLSNNYDEEVWDTISKYQNLTKKFILDHSHQLDKNLLRENPYVCKKIRKDEELQLLLALQ